MKNIMNKAFHIVSITLFIILVFGSIVGHVAAAKQQRIIDEIAMRSPAFPKDHYC